MGLHTLRGRGVGLLAAGSLLGGLLCFAGLCFTGCGVALGQVAAASPAPAATSSVAAAGDAQQLSPEAAYEQATRPLEIVRNATANWSDAEKNALGVAMSLATKECKARKASQYVGDDLLAYLQLCVLGWQWNAVQDGAWLYINARHKAAADDKTYTIAGLTAAYGYEIKSSLSLNDDQQAFSASQAMLREVPYTALVSSATSATIRYMQIVHTEQARALAAQRYLLLLDLLRDRGVPTPVAVAGAAPAVPTASLPVHLLYTDAIQWPMMMQFNKSFAPETVMEQLDAALPAKLSDDDAILTGEARRRYKLLGAPLPAIKAKADLADPKFAVPAEFGKGFGAATVLLMFPDWCAQCVAMQGEFLHAADRMSKLGVRFYAVLAQDGPPPAGPLAAKPVVVTPKPISGAKVKAPAPTVSVSVGDKPKSAAEILIGTPTLIAPRETLKDFVADDFPWLVVTDSQGIVRFVQAGPENVLELHSLADQVVDRVMQQWPGGGN